MQFYISRGCSIDFDLNYLCVWRMADWTVLVCDQFYELWFLCLTMLILQTSRVSNIGPILAADTEPEYRTPTLVQYWINIGRRYWIRIIGSQYWTNNGSTLDTNILVPLKISTFSILATYIGSILDQYWKTILVPNIGPILVPNIDPILVSNTYPNIGPLYCTIIGSTLENFCEKGRKNNCKQYKFDILTCMGPNSVF